MNAFIVSYDSPAACRKFIDAMHAIPDGHGITLHVGVQPVGVLKAASNLFTALKRLHAYITTPPNNDPTDFTPGDVEAVLDAAKWIAIAEGRE